MKLTSKFVLIYLVVTLIVLSIGGYLSYHIIKDEVDSELKWRFMDRVERITYLIEEGHIMDDTTSVSDEDRNLTIRQLSRQVEPKVEVRDTMVWHERLQQKEPNLKLIAHRNVNNKSYYIATYGALIETDDITEAVTKILLWILGMQVIGAIGVGFIVSNRLFKPFRETLNQLKAFNLQNKEPIEAGQANVEEFADLNHFVEQMTRKAVADYKNLKEFAENASHELQTPLAIIKGKLELLTETDLNPEQYQYVDDSQRAIKKLSRLSESLSLLTKIENHEFGDADEVNMTKLIRESTQSFHEFIKLNDLSVQTDLTEDVMVHIHPALADILWTNLFQNAIKHNIEEGKISITLTEETLTIGNTGKPLDMQPEKLFERFKKDAQNTESIGLGLSIIKQIVDQNGYQISYRYNDGWHNIKVTFS
ncbi:Signal transduction histidine kinase [Fodinibius salinus]|uniref:histidine kinase n=1 Tax=Fodinibius salinus TaxID=860790 RepID=A0A5D3YJM6_9BACT|nr:HAMP domain-containing sensor histidine kinase [Fodinibius salinus]TYP93650.1 Signal transduction histidine kinase [Fodinibius salinus]